MKYTYIFTLLCFFLLASCTQEKNTVTQVVPETVNQTQTELSSEEQNMLAEEKESMMKNQSGEMESAEMMKKEAMMKEDTMKKEEPLIRFETEAGIQMQVDWVEFPKEGISAFVATLGYSRMSYVEYVSDEKVETLIECHKNAFEYFGGVVPVCAAGELRDSRLRDQAQASDPAAETATTQGKQGQT